MSKIDFDEYLMQGRALLGNSKYEDAISYFNKAELEDNMNEDVYLYKGICYANMDKYLEAKNEFEKVLKISKNNGLACFHLGNIENLMGNRARGIELYNNALAYGFDDAQVYYSLGLMFEEDGDDDKAVRNYSKAIIKDPNRADVRLRKVSILVRNNKRQEALQSLDELILSNPDIFEGYHLKFLMLVEDKEYDKAEATIDSAMELFPKDPAFKLDKASLLTSKEQYDEALEALKAIEEETTVYPQLAHDIAMERTRIYTGKQDPKTLIHYLEEARNISRENDVQDFEESFLLMNCYVVENDFNKVLDMARYLKSVEGNEYYTLSANYYEGFALKNLGDTDGAKKLFEEAADFYRKKTLEFPTNLDIYSFRIMSLRELGQLDKALELADYLVKANDKSPEAHVLKSSVLEALGKDNEAEQERKQAELLKQA